MGSEDTRNPEYQMGEGCLVDQLVGQYLADVAGLGPLLRVANIRKALESILRYNSRRSLEEHDSVQRTYALNDESALLICDYGKAKRPRIPFPYYAEAWTGLEYMAGAQMVYAGLVREGVQLFENVRARHDGERRNPWNEPECGHHYARAMSAWSGVAALSGFLYHGATAAVTLTPRWGSGGGRSFWATGTGWGMYSRISNRVSIEVLHGSLPVQSCELQAPATARATIDSAPVPHATEQKGNRAALRFRNPVVVKTGGKLVIEG
jgi:hypothetical protein